jgi:hypothetical protein
MRTYEALWRKENPNQSKMQIRTTERETTEEEEEEEDEEDAEQNARKLESSKRTTTISIDTRKANIEKSNESDLRYVADQDWEYVISGHGLVGRCPSRVIRHNHKRLIQRPVAGGTRRQCPKASCRLHRNCCFFFFFFFFSLSVSPSSSSLTAGRASTMSRSSSSNRRII